MHNLPVVLICRREARLHRRANQWLQFGPSRDHKGRIAIVTDVGRGMRWTRWLCKTYAACRGRQRRVVLIPRRWDQALR